MKACTKCGKVYPPEHYWQNGKGKRSPQCNACSNARLRAYVEKNRDKRRGANNALYARNADKVYRANMHRKYGISPEQLDFLLNSAVCDICDICGKIEIERKLVVDHNHITGENRGILCSPCNAGLGSFQDDPAIMREAVRYLENNGSGYFL